MFHKQNKEDEIRSNNLVAVEDTPAMSCECVENSAPVHPKESTRVHDDNSENLASNNSVPRYERVCLSF